MEKHLPRLAPHGDDAPDLELEDVLNWLIADLCPHCVREREQRMRRSDRRIEGSRSHDNPPDT